MSKIRNLFKKITNRKKEADDLEDIFFDDTAQDNSEDETVIHDAPPEFSQSENDNSDIQEEYLDDEEDHEEFDYTMDSGTFTNEIDLENSKISIGDHVDQFKTRIADRFRNLNKKDLNKAFKKDKKTKLTQKIDLKNISNKVQSAQYDQILDKVLATKNHPKVHKYFQKVLTVCVVYTLANFIGSLISGDKDYNSSSGSIQLKNNQLISKSEISNIKNSNIFKTTSVKPVKPKDKPKRNTNTKCVKASSKSSLPIKLVHTVVLQDSVKSIASVTVRSKSTPQYLREGDKISTMAKIDRIERANIIVRNIQTGNCESISGSLKRMKSSAPPRFSVLTQKASSQYKAKLKKVDGIENNGNDFTIKRDLLESKLKDINSLLTQAKGIPINNPDGTMSFKIVEIQPDSIFASLGISNGDIINGINGEPIKNFNEVMGLFGRITKLNNLKLNVESNGESQTKSYNIK